MILQLKELFDNLFNVSNMNLVVVFSEIADFERGRKNNS